MDRRITIIKSGEVIKSFRAMRRARVVQLLCSSLAAYCTFWMEPATQKATDNPAVLSCRCCYVFKYFLFFLENLLTVHIHVYLTYVNSAEFRELKLAWDIMHKKVLN